MMGQTIKIIGYSRCNCGAITIFTEDKSYSCRNKNLKSFCPDIDLRKIVRYQKSFCCDHCVNHYGLDLCGCGSGEKFGKCGNGLPECKIPMQILGKYNRVLANDSWI